MKQNRKKLNTADSKQIFTVEELRSLIDKTLEKPLSSEERGRIYTDALLTYIQIKNEIDTAYLETLETGLAKLKELLDHERIQKNDVEKAVIRQKLQEINDLD
jgi:hypothetical protein